MKLLFKNTTERGEYPVDVALYNRAGERLAFDYDQCKKQIFIEGVTITQARWMIKEIESYIRDKMSLEAGAEEKIKVSSHEPIQQGANSGQLQQHNVMGRSELLIAFLDYVGKEEGLFVTDAKTMVDEFLKASNSP